MKICPVCELKRREITEPLAIFSVAYVCGGYAGANLVASGAKEDVSDIAMGALKASLCDTHREQMASPGFNRLMRSISGLYGEGRDPLAALSEQEERKAHKVPSTAPPVPPIFQDGGGADLRQRKRKR